ncbi:MAG: DUF1552 domain-containing protein [Mariniblastus sp.]
MQNRLSRRTFLRAAGVALALPTLEAMTPRVYAREMESPKRIVTICTSLGLHGPSLFPEETGAGYKSTKYLDLIKEHRDDFTLFSGLSHPDQNGADGHSSQMTWLSAARNPGLGGFRNTISLDQYVKQRLGYVTRFPSIILSTAGTNSQSYTRSGVMVPAEHRPSVLFEKMFLQGKPYEVERQKKLLNDGQSILDSLGSQTRTLQKRVSEADRERLEEYYESLRTAEKQFSQANAWLDKPKPIVGAEKPRDVAEENDLVGRTNLMMELIPLILQTDSSRMISFLIHGRNDVPKVPGVDIDHHNLSHHGQDEKKIKQLEKIEMELMKSFGLLLERLKEKKESSGNLLDNTMVLFGSNLGNANSHDWRNLPVMFAGGGFKHGQHVGFNKDDNKPLCNLFLTMLLKAGIETESFATSQGTLDW